MTLPRRPRSPPPALAPSATGVGGRVLGAPSASRARPQAAVRFDGGSCASAPGPSRLERQKSQSAMVREASRRKRAARTRPWVRYLRRLADHFDDRDDIERDIQGRRLHTSWLATLKAAVPDLALLVLISSLYFAVGTVVYYNAGMVWVDDDGVAHAWTIIDSVRLPSPHRPAAGARSALPAHRAPTPPRCACAAAAAGLLHDGVDVHGRPRRPLAPCVHAHVHRDPHVYGTRMACTHRWATATSRPRARRCRRSRW